MTYKDLLLRIGTMTAYQLSCDVTVELGSSEECLPAKLEFCDEHHEVLDEDHPVIYVEEA